MTYPDAFPVAILLGVSALMLVPLWIAWWLIADLGESVSGRLRHT